MNNVVHSFNIKPSKLFHKKEKKTLVYLIMIEMSVTHSQQTVGVMWVSEYDLLWEAAVHS